MNEKSNRNMLLVLLKVSIHTHILINLKVLFAFWPRGMWDLISSLTRDQTHAPCSGSTES